MLSTPIFPRTNCVPDATSGTIVCSPSIVNHDLDRNSSVGVDDMTASSKCLFHVQEAKIANDLGKFPVA